MASIRFIQTCDREKYSAMLEATSRSVLAYCRKFDCEFEMFVGIKRGSKPWHAALNRISILKRYVDRGYAGWVIYLDADAYIADLDFDAGAFLDENSRYAMIAAPSGGSPYEWWNINNGVFAINCGHPLGRRIVEEWYAALSAVPLPALKEERFWSELIDDQSALHAVLRSMPGLADQFLVDHHILNWNGRFIRQVIREMGSIDYRANRLKQLVNETLGEDGDSVFSSAEPIYRDFIHGLYSILLLRGPDPVGEASALELLMSGERNPMQEMRNCILSQEFAGNAARFLFHHLGRDRALQISSEIQQEFAG
jgi:hypothetical protein